jgi:phosphoserine phosphatase
MKKLIFFDFDGTLTDSSSWYLFNTYFGITAQEDDSLFKQYLQGSINYKGWMDEITKILKERGFCTKESVEKFAQTITLRSEAFEAIKMCKDAGYVVSILSGGIKQVILPVVAELGVDHVFTAVELVFDSEGKIESMIDHSDERHAKLVAFENVCAQYEVNPEEVIAVGDGGNDLDIFKKTKKGILLGSYEPLKEFAWKQVQNLSEIKELI